jgi:ribonuclease Z
MIDVSLLGTGGTLPLPERFLASALIRFGGHLILIDCGEGTQVSIRKLGWGIKDIDHVLLTHFHADHVAGLPGLLLTIGNSGRGPGEPLTIAGPRGVQRVVEQLRVIAPRLPYPVRYKELSGNPAEVLAIDGLQVRACLGEHDAPCLAYRFDLPRAPEFQPDRARALGLPVTFWKMLQRGETIEHEGRMVRPEEVLGPPRAGLALAYITDSRPTRDLVEFATDVDLLICEATYGDPADQPKAIENKHMTFAETAALAAAARTKQLWLTHFSPALPNPNYFRKQAEAVFSGVVIGADHMTTMLKFAD